MVETCYWVIRPERDIWLPNISSMSIAVERVQGGSLFFYEGTERSNTTVPMIEGGLPYSIGAPIRTNINNDIVVIFRKDLAAASQSASAGFKLSVQISGKKYAFWEKPFIGENEVFWYLAVIGIPVFLLFVFCVGTYCCCRCCNRGKCCHCCRCCNRTSSVEVDSQAFDQVKDPKVPEKKPNKYPVMSAQVADESTIIHHRRSSKKRSTDNEIEIESFSSDISEGPIPPEPKRAKESLQNSLDDLEQARAQIEKTNKFLIDRGLIKKEDIASAKSLRSNRH